MKSLLTSIKNTMHNKILFSFILVMLSGFNLQVASANTNNIKQIAMPAEWDKYGRSAGPIRNIQMLDMKPVLVLAFYNKVESKGTSHTVTEAKKRRIPVKIFGLVKK